MGGRGSFVGASSLGAVVGEAIMIGISDVEIFWLI